MVTTISKDKNAVFINCIVSVCVRCIKTLRYWKNECCQKHR